MSEEKIHNSTVKFFILYTFYFHPKQPNSLLITLLLSSHQKTKKGWKLLQPFIISSLVLQQRSNTHLNYLVAVGVFSVNT